MKRKKKSKGIITVFVTLMLVPMVVCTGTMVDAARLKLYSSQAAMVADSYGEVVLSEYDNLLKDLYGLFSVTQNEEGKKAIEDLAAYTTYSFIPNGDKEEGKGLTGYMPYKDAKIEVSYEAVAESKLSDNDVLLTQIGDFMKFRAIGELMKDAGIFEKLTQFEDSSKEMEIVAERSELTDGCSEILEKINNYYQVMKCLNDYPSYKSDIEEEFEDYAEALVKICTEKRFSGYTYHEYTYYLDNQDSIDAAKDKVDEKERIEAENQAEYDYEEWYEATFEEDYEPYIQTVPVVTAAEENRAEKWVNVTNFKRALTTELNKWGKSQATPEKNLIAFGEVPGKMTELANIANEISSQLITLKEKKDSLEAKLAQCDENSDFRKSMEAEIDELDKVTDLADEFQNTVTKLQTRDTVGIAGMDTTNKSNWENEIAKLEAIEEKILSGEQRTTNWAKSVGSKLKWYSFQSDATMRDFYNDLREICDSRVTTETEGDANAGQKKIDDAKNVENEAKEELEKDEDQPKARDIGELAGQLESAKAEDEAPDFTDMFTGGATFGAVANTALNKFLLVTYNFGMFSSRVTSVEPPEKEETPATPTVTPAAESEEKEEYKEYSLTKVEKSRDVNYLYEAELEYLIAGKDTSKSNLNFNRNIINTIRMSMNFIATYTISEINSAIETIATSAASAVAATGVGAPLAPVVQVAVSGALRLTVATLESVADWNLLKQREEVLFYKAKLGDLNATKILDFLDGEVKGDPSTAEKSTGVKLSYEDYLYIMMLLFTDEDNLLNRTANLITLNVNQSQNSTENDLETLNFKMTDTVTAVKSTCQVDLKFLIVPENMGNMFIRSGKETETTVQKLDDGTYAYSIIRGY